MGIAELFAELKDKECYKEAEKNFPDFYFCAAFLIMDLEQRGMKTQLDFFLPNEKKIISFEYPFENFKKHEDEIICSEQKKEIKFDVESLEKAVVSILVKNNIKSKTSKIIAILKNNEWNITAMDKMLGISRIKINADSGEEFFFEKGSLFDFMGVKKNN